jgi:hypothetical protein
VLDRLAVETASVLGYSRGCAYGILLVPKSWHNCCCVRCAQAPLVKPRAARARMSER